MRNPHSLRRSGAAAALFAAGGAGGIYYERHMKPLEEDVVTIVDAIGNTPLLEIKSLSAVTGCRILAKAEYGQFMNPSGSVKDRAAKFLIEDAEATGQLKPSGTVVEATGGNTGVGLAIVAAAKGYRTMFTMPDKTSTEKIELMKVLGASVMVQPMVPMDSPDNFYNVAKKVVEDNPVECCWPNQFKNLVNSEAHFTTTAREIWRQTAGAIDGFVVLRVRMQHKLQVHFRRSRVGTGGTIGGVSRFLKEKNPSIQVWNVDPAEGGATSDYINSQRTNSTMTGATAADSIENIPRRQGATARIDKGIFGSNAEIVQMAYYLLRHEGIFVGPSAALNVVGAVKMARELGPGHVVVTVLCDGGDRYRSKLFNPAWIKEKSLSEYVHAPLAL